MGSAFSLIIGKKEYYRPVMPGLNLSFGSGKKDNISISDMQPKQIVISTTGNGIAVTAKPPYQSIAAVQTNRPVLLHPNGSALIFCTTLAGKSGAVFRLPYNGTVRGGRAEDNHIRITFPFISKKHFMIRCSNGSYSIEDTGSLNGVFVNGNKVSAAPLRSGDVISIFTCRITLTEGELHFENVGSSLYLKRISEENAQDKVRHYDNSRRHMLYHRSPRTRERLPQDMIVLSTPPQLPGGGGGYGLMGSMGYLASNAFMMAMSMVGGSFSPAFLLARSAGMIPSVINMFRSAKMNKKQKAELEEYERLCVEKYENYIREQKAKINHAADIQRRIITSENPSPEECVAIMSELRKKLWERSPRDSDFLTVRIGMGYEKLCVDVKSRADLNAFQMQTSEMEQMSAQIIEETKYVDNVPSRVSLIDNNTLGIVGDRTDVLSLVRNMLIELTTFQDFKDVKLVGIFDEREQGRWAFMRWFPHIWDDDKQFRYLAFDEERVRSLCEILDDLIKKRMRESRNDYNNKKKTILPHYVILLGSRNQIMREPIYSILSSLPDDIGVSVIYLFDDIYNLPPDCQYIIEVGKESISYNRDCYDERVYFTPDSLVTRKDMDKFSRRMAAIETEEIHADADIPSSVSFLEGYGVQRVEDLDILNRWDRSHRSESLAAPVGMMANRKLFNLDIMDSDGCHGPHGLVAGTTGSGKSEFLQSWILSMAVSYHPYDVNFVIIDYKGGGMADLLEPLPHVVGKITNIDTDISRTLLSLQGERDRREKLFSKCGVNNIKKYQKAFYAGVAKIRLPHLVIVIDEFAELKREEPDFMRDLVSLARVGRTLGIHLVLATQKPGGVIDDQIDSNSKFRVCLKVQDVTDSREMLKRPDAARITQSGRAYVRVGEDEIFEQFQSLYSGAVYTGGTNQHGMAENLVRVVDVNGQKIQSLPKKKRDESLIDELTAVTKEINRVSERSGIEKLRGPWLPPLAQRLPLSRLHPDHIFDGQEWQEQKEYLRVPIGMYDAPYDQLQDVLFMDFEEQGHIAVYGIPGSGKTVLVETLLFSAGLKYSPHDLQIYILDFSSWMLREFQDMPHIAGIIRNDEEDRITRFSLNIKKEFDRRKALFLKHTVNSLSAYREHVSDDLPPILVVIDNILPVFNQMGALEELLYLLGSSGAAYGIHILYTANSTMGIPYKFTQLIKGAVALQLSDKGDYSQIVGQLNGIKPPYLAGRALLKNNPPIVFQTCVCFDEQNDRERFEKLQESILEMKRAWNGHEGQAENDLDEVSSFRPFADGEINYKVISSKQSSDLRNSYREPSKLPVGYDDDRQIRTVDLDSNYCLLLSAHERSTLDPYFAELADMLISSDQNEVYLIDGKDAMLREKANYVKSYSSYNEAASTEKTLTEIAMHLNQRKLQKSMQGLMAGSDSDTASEKRICIICADLPAISAFLTTSGKKMLWNIIRKSEGLNVALIFAGARGELLSLEEGNILLGAIKEENNAIFLDGTPDDYAFFNTALVNVGIETAHKNNVCLVLNGQAEWLSYANKEV